MSFTLAAADLLISGKTAKQSWPDLNEYVTITTSSYDSLEYLCSTYDNTYVNVYYALSKLRKVEVLFQIDATNLENRFPTRRFNCVCWNFPLMLDDRLVVGLDEQEKKRIINMRIESYSQNLWFLWTKYLRQKERLVYRFAIARFLCLIYMLLPGKPDLNV